MRSDFLKKNIAHPPQNSFLKKNLNASKPLSPNEQREGGERAARLFFFFPCSADHERDCVIKLLLHHRQGKSQF